MYYLILDFESKYESERESETVEPIDIHHFIVVYSS